MRCKILIVGLSALALLGCNRAGGPMRQLAEVRADRDGSPQFSFTNFWSFEMRRETIPPQALLIRRMEGLVLSTLGELRAGADWSALGSEYWGDEPPSTPLGEKDARFWGLPGFTG